MITKNFFVCGLTGWCMEILFTSTGSFLKQDKRLIREFDTLKSKKVPQSLEIGLFFCQIFIFII